MNAPVYLVTGVSGAGKSTLAGVLATHGVAAVDTDAEPGLARFVDAAGAHAERPAEPDDDWLADHRWEWNPARVAELVAAHHDRPLFLCGHADNETDFWHLFAAVFVLEVDEATMLVRLADPLRDNDYGTVGDTRALVCRWRPLFHERMRARGAVPVDAARPLPEVAAALLAATRG